MFSFQQKCTSTLLLISSPKRLRQRSQYTYFIIYKHVTFFQLFYKISLHIFTSNHPKLLPIPQPLFPPPFTYSPAKLLYSTSPPLLPSLAKTL